MKQIVLLGVVLAAFMPTRALAQIPIAPPITEIGSARSIDEIRSDYKLHAGPFYVDPALLLKELGVDTNVFNSTSDQKSDFTFTITPQADIAIPVARRALFRFDLGADFVYFATYASERSIDPQGTGRVEFYAHRLTFFAEDAYLNTRQRPNYEIDLRSRHLDNTVKAGVDVGLTSKTSVTFAARSERVRFDGDDDFMGSNLSQTLDRNQEGFEVALRDRLTPLTTLGARFERLHEAFPGSPVRDNDSYRIMPGLEFKPRALIKGFAYVGYRHLDPISSLLADYSGPVAQLGLAYTLLGATTFGVTYDRDITFSFEQATPYFLDNSVGVFIRRAVGGKWDVMANAARHRYDYRAVTLDAADPLNERRDRTDNYGASIGYRLKRDTRIGVGASYYQRTSTLSTLPDYDGLRAGLTVTYGF